MSKPSNKDSMKSTWRTQPRDQWTIHHHIIDFLNVHPVDLDIPVPVHEKTDKIPYVGQWSQNLWVLFHAFIPIALHEACLRYTNYVPGWFAIFNFYFTAFNIIVIREVQIIRRLGHTHGFLDGDQHERDGVPDVGVGKVAAALYKTTGSRILAATLLTYSAKESPTDALGDWRWWCWLTLEIGVYEIVLDFWFYWYHRAMHDVSFLWKFHRTHHLTKHPNPLLSAYADHEQEFFDMVGVPLMTWVTLRAMGFPMGFYDWWVCHQYVAYTEVLGHSGLRVHGQPPSTLSWLLQMFGAEIVVEDHDLHHRKGWRKSHNYGKQTRLWDTIFGTTTGRIESAPGLIDYEHQATMPLI